MTLTNKITEKKFSRDSVEVFQTDITDEKYRDDRMRVRVQESDDGLVFTGQVVDALNRPIERLMTMDVSVYLRDSLGYRKEETITLKSRKTGSIIPYPYPINDELSYRFESESFHYRVEATASPDFRAELVTLQQRIDVLEKQLSATTAQVSDLLRIVGGLDNGLGDIL